MSFLRVPGSNSRPKLLDSHRFLTTAPLPSHQGSWVCAGKQSTGVDELLRVNIVTSADDQCRQIR